MKQRVPVLYPATSSLDYRVVGRASCDGTGRARPTTGDGYHPPYETGTDALRDGWRLLQASRLSRPPEHELRQLVPSIKKLE